ncbi:MAG: hypothetical protein IKA61_05915 [Clostridia bacterium]|nr:hypothetical protein [Clostridia bacterium]
MTIFRWITALTKDLFATAQRPLFLVVDNAKNADFSNCICRILLIMGADVVHLSDIYQSSLTLYDCFDGEINVLDKFGRVELSLTKQCTEKNRKIYKKTFSQNSFWSIDYNAKV